jgi:hypothetical protein
MKLTEWFSYQLKAGGDGFVWAVQQMPVERRTIAPPAHPDEWPVQQHLFHMLSYDQYLSLPYIQYWLGGIQPSKATINQRMASQDEDYQRLDTDFATMLAAFQQVRAQQIELLQRFDDALWQTKHETVWGEVTMQWVVSKTFQHTAEHTHDVMRMVLFWR